MAGSLRVVRLVVVAVALFGYQFVVDVPVRAETLSDCSAFCTNSMDCNSPCLYDEGKGGGVTNCGESQVCDVASWDTCHYQCLTTTLCSQACLDDGSWSTCSGAGEVCDQQPNGICEYDEYCNTDPEDCGSCGSAGDYGIGNVIKGEGVSDLYDLRGACDAASLVWSTVGNCPVSIEFASVPPASRPSCAARDAYLEDAENMLEFVMLLEYHIESLDLEGYSGDLADARQELTNIVNELLGLSCYLL